MSDQRDNKRKEWYQQQISKTNFLNQLNEMYKVEHGRLASVPHNKRADEHLIAKGNQAVYLPSPPHASR